MLKYSLVMLALTHLLTDYGNNNKLLRYYNDCYLDTIVKIYSK